MRFAIVTETYPPEINGVALTVAGLESGLRDRGHAVDVVRPRQSPQQAPLAHETLVRSAQLPRYPGMRFGFPAGRLLRRHWTERRPDALYIATEGPLGDSALRAACQLGIPVRLGGGVFWYGLMAALVVFDGRTGLAASAHLAMTGVAALLLYRLLKRWTRRPRPFASDVRINAWVAPLDEFSFPSGHTLHAVAFTIVALAHYPGLAWLLLPFAASVGISRVVPGLHYPSDVLAATAIGGAIGWISMDMLAAVSSMA